jgi:hypothetical protein
LRILLLRAVHAIVLRVQWTWKLTEAALRPALCSTSRNILATEETPAHANTWTMALVAYTKS